jgi:hypothetical protein
MHHRIESGELFPAHLPDIAPELLHARKGRAEGALLEQTRIQSHDLVACSLESGHDRWPQVPSMSGDEDPLAHMPPLVDAVASPAFGRCWRSGAERKQS